jgi:hypothetical protein
MAKKPTSFTISNDKHTFTLRVGDKVFVTSRRYDPYNLDLVKQPDYLGVAEVTDIRGGKTPLVYVGRSAYDSKGACPGFGRESLEPYEEDRLIRHEVACRNHDEMSRASSALSLVQRGRWQTICNDPLKRDAIIALLGDDIPSLKETTR